MPHKWDNAVTSRLTKESVATRGLCLHGLALPHSATRFSVTGTNEPVIRAFIKRVLQLSDGVCPTSFALREQRGRRPGELSL